VAPIVPCRAVRLHADRAVLLIVVVCATQPGERVRA
jgi:hypothetical protein